MINELKGKIKGKKIYIYGTGVYGKTLFFFLREQEIADVEGFIVTEKNLSTCYILDRKVYALAEYKAFASLDNLIVVGVSNKYKESVVRNIETNKIDNVLVLNESLWNYVIENTMFHETYPPKNIAILMYHRVNNDNRDFWKLNVSKEIFEKHIEYIGKNYELLRLDDDWASIVNHQKKYIIITFDDGYIDNYKNALPILEKYKVPATFFVATNLIGTKDMYWWDELEALLLDGDCPSFIEFLGRKIGLETLECRQKACKEIRNYLKNLLPEEISLNMCNIRNIIQKKKAQTDMKRCINFEELIALSKSEYVSIGCHTKSHISMGENKSRQLMLDEVVNSKSILENYTSKQITTFAYPYGGLEDRCPLAEDVLINSGIKRAVIVGAGNVDVSSNMYALPRHMMTNNSDIEHILNRIWGIYG